ncbi:MAG: sugar ABC transporter permease [Lachnospiraceae bacterium]|nr:sugar ABC transporter permease [Lachnospiraceae bacterium]
MKQLVIPFRKTEKQNKPHHADKRTGKQRAISWGFLAPSVAGVFLFFVAPFFVVIYYSLINNVVRREFVGLSNFIRTIENNAFKLAAVNTMKFSLIAVPLAVVLSLLLAIVLMSRIPMKSTFRSFFLSPLMVPVASVVLIWQILFNYNGLVNDIVAVFGVDKIDWLKSPHAQVAIILLFLWKNLGYNMILFMAALASVPQDLIEVAKLEGANDFQIFYIVKLRFISSTILFVTIMSLINSFKVFREIYLMTGDYPYDSLYMLQHFMNNTFQALDYQRLSAAAILMALVMIVIIAVLMKTEDKFEKDIEE